VGQSQDRSVVPTTDLYAVPSAASGVVHLMIYVNIFPVEERKEKRPTSSDELGMRFRPHLILTLVESAGLHTRTHILHCNVMLSVAECALAHDVFTWQSLFYIRV